MQNRLSQLSASFFYNEQQGSHSCPADALAAEGIVCGCWMAFHNYNYFAGPYQDLKPAAMSSHLQHGHGYEPTTAAIAARLRTTSTTHFRHATIA